MSIFDKIVRKITNQDAIEIAVEANGKRERTGKTLQDLERLLGCLIETERNGERKSGNGRRKNDG